MEREDFVRLEGKIDKIHDKLDNHLERIAKVEEHSKATRGSVVILFSVFMTILGWVVYKAL